jgi:hypothetical protein
MRLLKTAAVKFDEVFQCALVWFLTFQRGSPTVSSFAVC